MPDQILTAEQVNEYHQKGFVVVPGVFDASETGSIKEHVIEALRNLGELGNRTGVHVWMCEVLDTNLRRWVTDKRIVNALGQLVGQNIEFLSVKSVYKDRGLRFASPWHQDWFYWHGSNKISVWIALDDATPENGCLRFIPATHRQVYDMVQVDEGNGFVLRVPESAFNGLQPETVPVRRGDAVFFHDLAIHGSHANVSGTDRWSLIATYRDASVKDDSDVWKSSIVLRGKSVNV
jgi:ectoine hydroxylase-related dioxygenase (phytanoyl-CoA dioxygenase family)